MWMKKILFIDDDKKYVDIIKGILEKNDFEVEGIHTSFEGIELAKKHSYDAYIIDLYLDQFQGVQVGEIIKMHNPKAIIVYVSNSTEANDELRCLRTGGSDFVSKESSIEVFVERVRKAICENKVSQYETILKSEFESLEINQRKGLILKNGEPVHLTNTELKILTLLFEHKNEVISRETIIEEIWQIPFNESEIEPRTIDTHIKNIKRKLGVRSIISVRGVGYRWYEK